MQHSYLQRVNKKNWFLFLIYRMLVDSHHVNYNPACTHRWPIHLLHHLQTKKFYCFKFCWNSLLLYIQHAFSSTSSPEICIKISNPLVPSFEGFCKLYSLMLHAHSSQMHWLYRKILFWYPACSDMHLSHNQFSHIFLEY